MRPVTPVGPLGRLGRWTATHGKLVALAWVALALPLGLLAPRVEHALSGAGWEASGSESVGRAHSSSASSRASRARR